MECARATWWGMFMPVGPGEQGCVVGAAGCAPVSSAPPVRPSRDPPADVMANGSAG